MKRTSKAKDRLRALEVRPSKKRGQNFLIDSSVISAIVEFGSPSAEEHIVEIGPGLGALTEKLRACGSSLAVIEIEEKFCRELAEKFPDVRVVNADVRKVDFADLGEKLVVFGNLPYSFSTDIIFHLISAAPRIKRAVLMLQKEFADRVAASPGGRDYGVLSIMCQLYADVVSGPKVPGTSFHPRTDVDSRVIELRFLDGMRYEVGDVKWFNRAVKAAFNQRRKKLLNSLLSSALFSREHIVEALSACCISPDCRAETLSIEQFVRLAKVLKQGN